MSNPVKKAFSSPYDSVPPAGAEGWQDLYPYFLTFRDKNKEADNKKFWFCDNTHWPTVFKPFDVTTVEYAIRCLGVYNTRHLMLPPANGIDYRIQEGYAYMSPVAVDPSLIGDRVPHFTQRAGHYFQNWDTLIANWHKKVDATIKEMDAIEFNKLPDMVDLDVILNGIGQDPSYELMENYNKMILLSYKIWQYHFEFLNLGYIGYLDFFGFCKGAFPGIPDLSISRMVAGVEIDLFRPDEELRKLSKLAVELGITSIIKENEVNQGLALLAGSAQGKTWLEVWEAAKDPWFNFTSGTGFYSSDKYWIEYLDIPYGYIQDYVKSLETGKNIDRPVAHIIAERNRIIEEYRDLLDDEESKTAFDQKLGLAQLVFPYVENHNFYIEHWAMSIFWKKMKQLSSMLHAEGFWNNADDMFFLKRTEIPEVLFDYGNGWAVGVDPVGPDYWPEEISRRKVILDALATRPAQTAFNEPPEVVTEPFTIMLYGITTDTVQRWLGDAETEGVLNGIAASPGTVEGLARIIRNSNDLKDLQQDEILVTMVTAPSWVSVFNRIKATVTDIGGQMSHAAIVCREYGLPAVTGTGSATSAIKTGDLIRVDGSKGVVTILVKATAAEAVSESNLMDVNG